MRVTVFWNKERRDGRQAARRFFALSEHGGSTADSLHFSARPAHPSSDNVGAQCDQQSIDDHATNHVAHAHMLRLCNPTGRRNCATTKRRSTIANASLLNFGRRLSPEADCRSAQRSNNLLLRRDNQQRVSSALTGPYERPVVHEAARRSPFVGAQRIRRLWADRRYSKAIVNWC
jgi:hypothetical protein